MTMKKILLTTHWSPSEVHAVLQCLNELTEAIANNYADELNQFYQETAVEEQQTLFDFEDDIIPF